MFIAEYKSADGTWRVIGGDYGAGVSRSTAIGRAQKWVGETRVRRVK
tara:strand:+ start:1176 stop:1316 length:141 start_codon:yes stop_codon:yes gene_type:complete